LLGSFRLTSGDEEVHLSHAAQRVVAFLALRTHPIRRGNLAETLWPDVDVERAHGNLRSALWRLRRASRPLIACDEVVQLAEGIDVDLRETTALGRRLLGSLSAVPDPGRLASGFGADLLPDWIEDWVVFERDRFRELRLSVLEHLCRWLTARGRFPEAVDAGLLAIEAEPLQESAHRALIEAFLAQGNRGRALRQFESLRRTLQAELGVEPTLHLDEIHLQAATG
jgi:DNA-binding SARP family transcriptional activator